MHRIPSLSESEPLLPITESKKVNLSRKQPNRWRVLSTTNLLTVAVCVILVMALIYSLMPEPERPIDKFTAFSEMPRGLNVMCQESGREEVKKYIRFPGLDKDKMFEVMMACDRKIGRCEERFQCIEDYQKL